MCVLYTAYTPVLQLTLQSYILPIIRSTVLKSSRNSFVASRAWNEIGGAEMTVMAET